MTIHHHPDDDLLVDLAAGALGAGRALVLTVHLDRCSHCRERLHALQALGGALLEDTEPMALDAGAWVRTLERIDALPGQEVRPGRRPAAAWRAPLPDGLELPASLRGCGSTPWRWGGPGVKFSRVQVAAEPDGSVFLLRIGAGRSLPRHSHGEVEFTQVLCGGFADGRASFEPGDFDAADDSVLHQPVVGPDRECVCLAYLSAPLRFEGKLASLMGGLIGL
ncbi:MAG: ChrR family anti-sigma-E factor [Burkholderiaceae bacterium]